jgi:hypothetical protein
MLKIIVVAVMVNLFCYLNMKKPFIFLGITILIILLIIIYQSRLSPAFFYNETNVANFTLQENISTEETLSLLQNKEELKRCITNKKCYFQVLELPNFNPDRDSYIIQQKVRDDSLNQYRYLVKLEKTNSKWQLVKIKKRWQCQDGRGHFWWSTQSCS